MSFRNISILIITSYTFWGVLFLPYSLTLEHFIIDNPELYSNSINKSVLFHIIALWSFLLTIICFDRIKKGRSTDKNSGCLAKLLSYPERINHLQLSRTLILFLFVLFASIMIYVTFWYTGNTPYCNFNDSSAKYFSGFTGKYITMRPFYVLGQHLLAIAGFILLYFFIETLKTKRIKTAVILLILFFFSSFPLLLTMKRGEIFFPIMMYIGGMVLLNRIRIIQVAIIAIVLIWSALILDPGKSSRPLAHFVCSRIVQVIPNQTILNQIIPNQTVISNQTILNQILPNQTTIPSFMNSFFVQIRDSSRLLYNFELKKERYVYGRTYIASAFGFIPTSIFPFKEKYNIGRITLKLFGLNPETSGGPRIGIIGESYINFGFIGVIILPCILGILVCIFDNHYMWIFKNYKGEHKLLHMIFMFIILNHLITGVYLDGSGAIQTFIIRAGIMVVIFSVLLCGNRPVEGIERL